LKMHPRRLARSTREAARPVVNRVLRPIDSSTSPETRRPLSRRSVRVSKLGRQRVPNPTRQVSTLEVIGLRAGPSAGIPHAEPTASIHRREITRRALRMAYANRPSPPGALLRARALRMDCPECNHPLPVEAEQCPHCGRPALFPNVRKVEQEEKETRALDTRYQTAVTDATARGCKDTAAAFEAAVATSTAVIGRPLEEALRLAKGDNQAYATYWALLHAGVRLPDGDEWGPLRGQAEEVLFGSNRDKMRMASLSLDGECLRSYGDVSLELADSMICHRTTVFEENSAVFFQRERKHGHEPPHVAGHRAHWADRAKLAVAKHASEISPTTTTADFPTILAHNGRTSAKDVFIEAHVHGSITRRSLKRVVLFKVAGREALAADLRDRLDKVGVAVEER
jgi:hypothetical protein